MHFGAKLLSRDCVAYTSLIKSPYGSKFPTAFFSFLCTYLSNAKFLVPMRLGETPVPIPNTTVKTQSADGTALETVWESRWAPDQKRKNWIYRWWEILNKDLKFLMTDKASVDMYLENCIHEIWLKVNQISLIQNVKRLYESMIQTQDRKTSIYLL